MFCKFREKRWQSGAPHSTVPHSAWKALYSFLQAFRNPSTYLHLLLLYPSISTLQIVQLGVLPVSFLLCPNWAEWTPDSTLPRHPLWPNRLGLAWIFIQLFNHTVQPAPGALQILHRTSERNPVLYYLDLAPNNSKNIVLRYDPYFLALAPAARWLALHDRPLANMTVFSGALWDNKPDNILCTAIALIFTSFNLIFCRGTALLIRNTRMRFHLLTWTKSLLQDNLKDVCSDHRWRSQYI